MSVSVFCVLVYTGMAALLDLRTRKISNTVILCGWSAGLGLWLGAQGYRGCLYWLAGISGTLLPGMVLYLLRGLGAGDVKLLSVSGGILGLRRGIRLFVAALFLGGLLGLAAVCRAGEGRACLGRMGNYIHGLFTGGKTVWPKGQGIKICYAAAVFGASVLLAVWEGRWLLWPK
ncbi:MAG TPA: hypothetical protein DF613_11655 [Lachnospiraceae bacterium]|nr:hypothetical protein [Lachnospiraceae bacterium]